jgi:outer membrane lipoprotein carrier protein
MQSFQGNFQQTTIIESEARRASASGMIAYQRPGKMRWEYQVGDPQLLVTDGNTLWLYDPLLENVTIQELAVVTDGTPLAFLLGAGELTDDFTQRRMQKSLLDPDKSWKVLELVPNQEKSAIEFLQLGVDSESGDLGALLFKDNSGSVRIIEFEALSYNVEFSEGFFSFEIPPGMEVIRP